MIPCDCCGGGCVIGADPFDGTLAGWTEESGTWAIDTGLLEGTGAGSIIFDAAVPSVDTAYRAYTGALNTSTDGTVRLKVCWSDDDNYLFGEFSISGSGAVLVLGAVVGGSESSLGDGIVVEDTGAELDVRSTLCLEFNPGPVQEAEEFTVVARFGTTVTFDGDWQSPANILADDGAAATHPGFTSGEISGVIAESDFQLAIPPGSTIDGIAVAVEAKGTDTILNTLRFHTVQLAGGWAYNSGSSDNRSGSEALGGAFALYGFGGPTDTWGITDLSWEHLNHPAFAVALKFQLGVGNPGGTVHIDYVAIDVYYTTPERRPGRLRFSRTNTGAPQNSQCVTEYSVENPAGGLKTGIGIIGGDWDFDAWHVEHHQADRAECDVCECTVAEVPCDGCCDQAFMPAESHVVDLGDGGWVGGCEACEEVEGVFILDPIGECGWGYLEPKNCNAGVCGTGNLHLVLFLMGETPDCFWRLVVSMNFTSSSPGNDCTVVATYESATLADDEACQTMPVTLTKVSDPGSLQCGGALPATITLDAA